MKKFNYHLFKEMVENEKVIRISDANNIVECIIVDSHKDLDDYENSSYDESNYKKLYDIACMFEDDNLSIIGIDVDYHNLSVKYAKEDYYDSACKILTRGLEKYPYSINLLSDFLSYATQSNKFYEQSKEYFDKLKTISFTDWNWRAFSFAIDYLLDKKNREYSFSSSIKSESLSLADLFIRNVSEEYVDQAYFYKSTIFKSYNEDLKEREVLELGAKTSNRPLKCCFRLADIEFSSGNYDKAVSYIDRCWRILDKLPEVNKGYTFLLLALSKTSQFLKDFDSTVEINDEVKKKIELIYKDFYSAYDIVDSNYKKSIELIFSVLETQTGIKNKFNIGNLEYDI